MAKVVSEKREYVSPDRRKVNTVEAKPSAAVTAFGGALVALFVVGAIAMVVATFNFRP